MPMFTGLEEGNPLSPDLARKKVRKFNGNRKKEDIKAHYFSRKVLEELLADINNVGIRFYMGHNDKAVHDNFIVAVNADGDNVFNGEFTIEGSKDMPASGSGIYASDLPCPKNCPSQNTDFA
jgi:formylmethanofuran dehydrogenase subunit C